MTVLLLTKQTKKAYERRRLEESFADKKIKTTVKHPKDFDLVVTHEIEHSVKLNGQDFEWPKFVILRGTSGENNFNLAIMREFEQAGIPVINSPTAIENARDKLRTCQILANNGIRIPKTLMFKWPVDEELIEREIGWPCVVKVVSGSQGNGVYLCKKRKHFKALMNMAVTLGNRQTLIVQEYMADRVGEDLRVLVVGGRVIGAMRRISNDDFRANISQGGHGEPFPVSDEIDYISREAARLLGLEVAGIDLLFDGDSFRVCEVNSNPGFRGFERYCDVNVADAITEYIRLKIQ
jgi:RimK family alpha-L-glutamate ligase